VLKQERGLHNKKFIAEFSLLHKKRSVKIYSGNYLVYIDQFGLNSNIEDIAFQASYQNKEWEMLPANYKIN
jgi:hypothetical protein